MNPERSEVPPDWTLSSFAAHVEAMFRSQRTLMDERDIRYAQRYTQQTEALEAALTAADRAVAKAETASEKRFEGVNEFRATLADQAGTLMPRAEAEIRFESLTKAIAANTDALNLIRGGERRKGSTRELAGMVLGLIVGFAGIAVAIVVAVTR